jgi:hypothetical protein
MGVYISSPFLVNAFSKACEKFGINGLGTVSGTAAERILVAILQRGDPGGHYRRALAHFPFQDVAKRILDEYFDHTGNSKKTAPFYNINPSPKWIELAVAANFAFVWLAKEGHSRPVSINYLEKISLPFIYYLTGAMMAGVDVVSMGAGVVLKVPEVIDALLRSQTLRYPIPVIEADGSHGTIEASFNPWEFFGRKKDPNDNDSISDSEFQCDLSVTTDDINTDKDSIIDSQLSQSDLHSIAEDQQADIHQLKLSLKRTKKVYFAALQWALQYVPSTITFPANIHDEKSWKQFLLSHINP